MRSAAAAALLVRIGDGHRIGSVRVGIAGPESGVGKLLSRAHSRYPRSHGVFSLIALVAGRSEGIFSTAVEGERCRRRNGTRAPPGRERSAI